MKIVSVASGVKYGCDYIIKTDNESLHHNYMLVLVEDTLSLKEFVRYSRISTSVHKDVIIYFKNTESYVVVAFDKSKYLSNL